jgi:ATP-dependent Clp protease ATP-binding subunit ClpA
MGADERNRYINMVSHLQKRIIGQEMAVLALSRAVKMARVGLKDPRRPIGSFLFLGPTGVGKSELAKALAEFMFGTERALVTLDMSEYMEASSVNRLIGSPPGYVGHESGGQLTDTIKKQPYSVILFDEVEKADRKVFDTLLQVMDEGRLTSGQGETVSFSECVILMTSNIGGEHLADVRLSQNMASETNPDGEVDAVYYADNVRQLLEAGFGDDELLALFGTDPTFALDDDLIRANPDKETTINHIITQAEQKSQFDLLLQLAENFNPAKFDEYQPYFNWTVACRRAEAALKGHFRPEFLNRLDDIIYFHPLNDEHLRKILDLMLKKEEQLLQTRQLKLELSEPAKSWLLDQNEHPEWGARPLRRLLQRHIRESLAEFILVENPAPGSLMRVRVRNGQLEIMQAKRKKT